MVDLLIIIFFIILAILILFAFILDRNTSISEELEHNFEQVTILIDAIEEAISINPEELSKYYQDLYDLLKNNIVINGKYHLSDTQKIKCLLQKQVDLHNLYKKIIREIPISKGGEFDDSKKYDVEEQHQENN